MGLYQISWHGGFVPTDDLEAGYPFTGCTVWYYLYGGKDADYDLTVAAKDGSVALYHGLERSMTQVSGADQIPNGQVLHIQQRQIQARMAWGKDGL